MGARPPQPLRSHQWCVACAVWATAAGTRDLLEAFSDDAASGGATASGGWCANGSEAGTQCKGGSAECNATAPSRMTADIAVLAAWLEEKGGTVHPCLSIVSCGQGGGGRCAEAVCDVERGEKLLIVPAIAQLVPEHHVEFELELDRSGGDGTLGLNLTHDNSLGAGVEAVLPGGAVDLWNIAHPGWEIGAGATVLEANGMGGKFKTVTEELERDAEDIVLQLRMRLQATMPRCLEDGISAAQGQADAESVRLALRLLQEHRLGEASDFATYIKLIQGDFHPLQWRQDVQRRCLVGTPAELRITTRSAGQRADLQALAGCGMASPSLESFSLGLEHDPDLRWARHVVRARSYGYAPEREDGKSGIALVPMGDLFSDDTAPNTQWTRSPKTGIFEVVARGAISAGDQLTMSYGSKPNENLLLQYGFVFQDNPTDFVLIDLLGGSFEVLADITQHGVLVLSLQPAALLMLPSALEAHRSSLQESPHLHSRLAILGKSADPVAESEAASLEAIKLGCDMLAARWTPSWAEDAGPECGEACARYRSELARLAQGCSSFAVQALYALGYRSSADAFRAQTEADEGVAKTLAEVMLGIWWQDAASRLPRELGTRCADTPQEPDALNADSVLVQIHSEPGADTTSREVTLLLSPSAATALGLPVALHGYREVLRTFPEIQFRLALAKNPEVELEALTLEQLQNRCSAVEAHVIYFAHLAHLGEACSVMAAGALEALSPGLGGGVLRAATREAQGLADMWFRAWWRDAVVRLPERLGDRCAEDPYWFVRVDQDASTLFIDLNDRRTSPNSTPRFQLVLSEADGAADSLTVALQAHAEMLLSSSGQRAVARRFRIAMGKGGTIGTEEARGLADIVVEMDSLHEVRLRCVAAASYFSGSNAQVRKMQILASGCAVFAAEALRELGHPIKGDSLAVGPASRRLSQRWLMSWMTEVEVRSPRMLAGRCAAGPLGDTAQTDVFLELEVPFVVAGEPRAVELLLSSSEAGRRALPFTLQRYRAVIASSAQLRFGLAINEQATTVVIESMALEAVLQGCAIAERYLADYASLASLARGCIEFARLALVEIGRLVVWKPLSKAAPADAWELYDSWFATWWADASGRLPHLLGNRCLAEEEVHHEVIPQDNLQDDADVRAQALGQTSLDVFDDESDGFSE